MYKSVEFTQHTLEQPVGQSINQKGNQKVSWYRWKWTHNISNFCNVAKGVLIGKFTVIKKDLK